MLSIFFALFDILSSQELDALVMHMPLPRNQLPSILIPTSKRRERPPKYVLGWIFPPALLIEKAQARGVVQWTYNKRFVNKLGTLQALVDSVEEELGLADFLPRDYTAFYARVREVGAEYCFIIRHNYSLQRDLTDDMIAKIRDTLDLEEEPKWYPFWLQAHWTLSRRSRKTRRRR